VRSAIQCKKVDKIKRLYADSLLLDARTKIPHNSTRAIHIHGVEIIAQETCRP
jgi:hypothetical protein